MMSTTDSRRLRRPKGASVRGSQLALAGTGAQLASLLALLVLLLATLSLEFVQAEQKEKCQEREVSHHQWFMKRDGGRMNVR